MKWHKPFAELPARLVLSLYEQHIIQEARAIVQRARDAEDSDTLGRADSALDDVLETYGK